MLFAGDLGVVVVGSTRLDARTGSAGSGCVMIILKLFVLWRMGVVSGHGEWDGASLSGGDGEERS